MKNIITVVCIPLLLAAASLPIRAGNDTRLQASMLVTGKISVAADGSVANWSLDKTDKLPPQVVQLIGKTVPDWKFEPVMKDGHAVSAQAPMRIRVVARPTDDEHFNIRIVSAFFGDKANGKWLKAQNNARPHYPMAALKDGVGGTVYTVMSINREGKPDKIAVEQVNLFNQSGPHRMKRWRHLLADASLDVLKRWRFSTHGPEKLDGRSHWIVRIPVTYRLSRNRRSRPEFVKYGQWEVYVPGPKHNIDWLDKDNRISGSPDALPSSGIFMADQGGLHLLNRPAS